MTLQLFLQGIAAGACAAFPLGPMGMICIQRILAQGPRAGAATAGAIALAAALWCVVVAQGLGLLAERISLNTAAAKLLLGGFLVLVAVWNLWRPDCVNGKSAGSLHLAGQFFSTLLVVLPNPITVLTVTAVLAAFGLGERRLNLGAACGLSVAVFVGGLILWLLIARALVQLRHRLGEDATRRVRRLINYCTLMLGTLYLVGGVL